MVILDTCVWSRLLRRRPDALTEEAAQQVAAARGAGLYPVIVGVALQELLSGVHDAQRYRRLATRMASFRVLLATEEHHRQAAELANAAGRAGIAAGLIDCLIAVQAIDAGAPVLTFDDDFRRLAETRPTLQLFRG